jgi:hypothetical protein
MMRARPVKSLPADLFEIVPQSVVGGPVASPGAFLATLQSSARRNRTKTPFRGSTKTAWQNVFCTHFVLFGPRELLEKKTIRSPMGARRLRPTVSVVACFSRFGSQVGQLECNARSYPNARNIFHVCMAAHGPIPRPPLRLHAIMIALAPAGTNSGMIFYRRLGIRNIFYPA